ncbi:unnamed protein product [Prorocentrum cordatum]|uniref:Uncharacterized protein n=1 Tax=Prorocentrum cordatum TaxID=2364126 RepID=A0ABN9QMZ0_9DINO|nr:unnamed protein product [Polarella glacialis]
MLPDACAWTDMQPASPRGPAAGEPAGTRPSDEETGSTSGGARGSPEASASSRRRRSKRRPRAGGRGGSARRSAAAEQRGAAPALSAQEALELRRQRGWASLDPEKRAEDLDNSEKEGALEVS